MNQVPHIKTPPVARVGEPLALVSTPALLLDLDAFEANVAGMAALAQRHAVALRPHAKAHKSSAIARRQMEVGAAGICCQKLSEAYPFIAAGVRDIHISNEVVGPRKIEMAIELAGQASISVCVDHLAQVDAFGKAAADANVSLTLLPEVDIGQGRCGVTGTQALIALVERIAHYRHLRFGGLQAYHGGIQHVASWDQRRVAAEIAAEKAAQYVAYLDALGIVCPVVTGGGTGTVEFDMRTGVYTELQPGSYIFMDAHYGKDEWHGEWRPRHSLFIASTIMSTAKPGMAVCDVGLKGVAVDSGLPLVKPGQCADVLQYVAANDEHGTMQVAAGDQQDHLGRQILLIPGHCDPTANLYQQYVCFRNDTVEDLWDIDARGLSQ
jgi:D-serine deaminase-like pyridoxal phosphate-dependent protein